MKTYEAALRVNGPQLLTVYSSADFWDRFWKTKEFLYTLENCEIIAELKSAIEGAGELGNQTAWLKKPVWEPLQTAIEGLFWISQFE